MGRGLLAQALLPVAGWASGKALGKASGKASSKASGSGSGWGEVSWRRLCCRSRSTLTTVPRRMPSTMLSAEMATSAR